MNPTYYSRYHISTIFENLGYKGSVPSEQNHASNIAHIGQGGNFSIAEHIKKLYDGQIYLST